MRICATLYQCLVLLAHTLTAQDMEVFRLPNGLEIQTRQMANTGIIHARLTFSWTEGTDHAPIGTAWIMSKILPVLGSGGIDNEMFHNRKDQFGTLSRIECGREWIAWIFNAAPMDADMMFQILADESLRPFWTKSKMLPAVVFKANDDILFLNTRETAIHSFRCNIGDAAIPQIPVAPIEQRELVAIWTNVIRRPEKAVLSVAGDLESISLKRLVHQHFGPWEGVRTDNADTTIPPKAKELPKPEWPGPIRRFVADVGLSEVWIAWNLKTLSSEDAALTMALVPWLFKAALPMSDDIIDVWQADPDGRWISAIGQSGVSAEKLESHLKSALNLPITQNLLNRAIKNRNDYIQANALHPGRVLHQNTALPSPTLDAMKHMIEKCMKPDNLAALLIGR
ncbi:MAG: hypothetical protein LBH03_05510 [Holophagales bacterium]|jgi:hypothetical protein|nr:hypothetical protein [Holophagales bacterium]